MKAYKISPHSVPWALMEYPDVVSRGLLGDVKKHINEKLTGDQRKYYANYLVVWCGFPRKELSEWVIDHV